MELRDRTMQEQSDYLIILVVIVAFIAGYLLVGFIIKRVQKLRELPSLNEELWRQQEAANEAKRQKSTDVRRPDRALEEREQSRETQDKSGQPERGGNGREDTE